MQRADLCCCGEGILIIKPMKLKISYLSGDLAFPFVA
jgi:hypothetical protein